MSALERIEGETAFEYAKRLVYGKLEDKTLADADYSELASCLFNKEYSSDSARKAMYGAYQLLHLLDSDGYSPACKHDDVVDAASKERQKFYDQRREYNRIVSYESRFEHICETLKESADKLNETVNLCWRDNSILSDGGNHAVIVFSDWHFGMTANGAFNTYNTDICQQRIKSVVAEAEKRIELNRCEDLTILVLGDLIHGACHVSARVASEELVCDQIMKVSEILAQAINELSCYVEHTDVYMTYGNHARTVQSKQDSIHRDNMERICRWWLEQRLKDNDHIIVKPEFENEFIICNVGGKCICATHGDLDSISSSPRLLSVMFRKNYGLDVDCVILADKHHRTEMEQSGISTYLVGSLCGTDEYANNKRLFSEPEQLMLIINDECGFDATYHLKC